MTVKDLTAIFSQDLKYFNYLFSSKHFKVSMLYWTSLKYLKKTKQDVHYPTEPWCWMKSYIRAWTLQWRCMRRGCPSCSGTLQLPWAQSVGTLGCWWTRWGSGTWPPHTVPGPGPWWGCRACRPCGSCDRCLACSVCALNLLASQRRRTCK